MPRKRLSTPFASAPAESIIKYLRFGIMERAVLRILKYPHPALRHESKPLRRFDSELKSMVRGMFDLMYEQKGVGLAANQVGLPYRFFILNLEGDPAKAPEHVFINPGDQTGGRHGGERGGLPELPGNLRPSKAVGKTGPQWPAILKAKRSITI